MATGNLLPSVPDSVRGLAQSAAGLGAYISSYFESTTTSETRRSGGRSARGSSQGVHISGIAGVSDGAGSKVSSEMESAFGVNRSGAGNINSMGRVRFSGVSDASVASCAQDESTLLGASSAVVDNCDADSTGQSAPEEHAHAGEPIAPQVNGVKEEITPEHIAPQANGVKEEITPEGKEGDLSGKELALGNEYAPTAHRDGNTIGNAGGQHADTSDEQVPVEDVENNDEPVLERDSKVKDETTS